MEKCIYTIGHSTHSIEEFIKLLKLYNIDVVADVRSSPYSRQNPQYNKNELKQSLCNKNIRYVFLGRELGARSENPNHYVNNKVQYSLLSKSKSFTSGIDRLLEGIKTYKIALMCAEKEPLECHRTILVSRELIKHGLTVRHILSGGKVEEHNKTIKRLISSLGMSVNDMYLDDNEIEELAYCKQGEKIAYVRQ